MIGFGTPREFSLGRPFGIPLGVQTWLAYLMGGLVAFAVLTRRPLDGTWIVILFLSILLHEWGHALSARWSGDRVLKVTLHLLGGATFRAGATTASQDLRITAYGPLVNVALATGAWALLRFHGPTMDWWAAVLVFQVFWINLLLAVFNVLPIHPMDGGAMARLLLQRWLGRGAGTRASLGLSMATLIAVAVYLVATESFGLIVAVILFQLFMLNVFEMRATGPPSLVELRDALDARRRRREARRAERDAKRRDAREREDRDHRVLRDGPKLLDRALERGLGSLAPEERRLLMLHRRLIEIRVDSAAGDPDPADLRLLEKHVMLSSAERLH